MAHEMEYVYAQFDELLNRLPEFCRDYFIHIENKATIKTCIGYAYDLSVFFNYIKNELGKEPTIELLDSFTFKDIDLFIHYVTEYTDEAGIKHNNTIEGKRRKVATLRSFYSYLFKQHLVENNPALLVETPTRRKKEIVTLEPDEAATLLDNIEEGKGLSPHQKKITEKTKLRDIAIVTLLLGTGMRVSECVGINIDDVDFDNATIKIIRKGNKEQIIYIGDEVINALKSYLKDERHTYTSIKSEKALFLSLKHQRIGVRAVQKIVKKYAKSVTVKNITPHKLRSSYGTALYEETNDIYLTAAALGHENISTTQQYYAKMNKNRLKSARNAVKIRED